jgi:hypothetical protein
MLSPKKYLLGLALVAALVFAGGALAAGGGNSANAKLCQKDGWQTLMDWSAAAFPNQGACVSYGAHGGAIYALASLHVEPCAGQPFDGLCVSTSGFGLAPPTFVTNTAAEEQRGRHHGVPDRPGRRDRERIALRPLRGAVCSRQRLLGDGHRHLGRLAEHAHDAGHSDHLEHRHAHVQLPLAVPEQRREEAASSGPSLWCGQPHRETQAGRIPVNASG